MAVSFKLLFRIPRSEYLNQFSGQTVLLSPQPGPGMYLPTDLVPLRTTISQEGYSITFQFNNVRRGKYSCAFAIGQFVFWKSNILDITTGDEYFEFHLVRRNEGQVIKQSQFISNLPSINERIDNTLEERVILRRQDMDLQIQENRIRIFGSGLFTKDEPSLLGSEFSFRYYFQLSPTESFFPGRMIEIVDERPISLEFENLILEVLNTLFPTFLADHIRKMMEDQINESMAEYARSELSNLLGDASDLEKATVTVHGARHVPITNEEGGQEYAIRFDLTLSLPAASVPNRGCLGSVLSIAVVFTVMIFLLYFLS